MLTVVLTRDSFFTTSTELSIIVPTIFQYCMYDCSIVDVLMMVSIESYVSEKQNAGFNLEIKLGLLS